MVYRRAANHCSTVTIAVVPTNPTNVPSTPKNCVQLLQCGAAVEAAVAGRAVGALHIMRETLPRLLVYAMPCCI